MSDKAPQAGKSTFAEFRGISCRVETAVNGQEGFALAALNFPDLIISDVMMPVMDGIAMLDKLRHTPGTSHIPVMLLSARSSAESRIEALNYGAAYFSTCFKHYSGYAPSEYMKRQVAKGT